MNCEFTAEELFVLRIAAADRVPVRLLSLDAQRMREQWSPYYSSDLNHALIVDAVTKLAREDCVNSTMDGSMQLIEITSKGAESWEAASKPDWSKFMVQRWRTLREDVSRVSMICGSDSLRANAIGMSVPCLGLCPGFGIRRIRFKNLDRWQATYWKTLETGFFVSFVARIDTSPAYATSDHTDCSLFMPWGRNQSDW